MARPKVIINCVASHYANADERIVEFSDKSKDIDLYGGMHYAGGLIRLFRHEGKLQVSIYNCDNTQVWVAGKYQPGFVHVDIRQLEEDVEKLSNLIRTAKLSRVLTHDDMDIFERIGNTLDAIVAALDKHRQCVLA